MALAKQRAKIPADSDVELVVYPPRKSFYELLADQFTGALGDQAAIGAVDDGEPVGRASSSARATDARPVAMFRRGEPLALMPFTFCGDAA